MSIRPTKILSDEHRVIEVALECLERLVDKTMADRKLEKQSAEDILTFIREFADGCHHAKEENRLFPAMVEKGVPQEGGPIGVMLNDHEQGREYVRGMVEQVDSAASGNEEAVHKFCENALGYADLMRMHISKEDNVLFPMADNIFSPEEDAQMLERFKESEIELLGDGDRERYLKLASALAEKFGVSTDPINSASCACGRLLDKV